MKGRADPNQPQSTVTVWFDGACPLCAREIGLMRRLDRRGALNLIDLQDSSTICPIDRAAMLERFHVLENGQLLHGAEAFAAMWRVLPALRLLGLAARYRPILWLLEHAYLGFLKVRPSLQSVARLLT